MSKMFDYVSGKKDGEIARLEAELEHVLAHCVPASALDDQRDAVIEECAQVAESYPAINEVQRRLVAAAIRALKLKEG